MKLLIAVATLSISAGLAQAETFDSNGTITGKAGTTITPLSETHMIMFAPSSHDAFDMEAAGHPFADMSGDCIGTVEVSGPAASGSGHCIYTNSADEMLVVNWLAQKFGADGAMHGDWVIIGGTGGMAEASGGGTFVTLTDRSNGDSKTTLTGAITVN